MSARSFGGTADRRSSLRRFAAARRRRPHLHNPKAGFASLRPRGLRAAGLMTADQFTVSTNAVASRLNIVVSGGTGSAKTTLANAVIAAIVSHAPEHRLVILEDTDEIQCAAEITVSLHTSYTLDMARLLKGTMRLRPDRIVVREVRNGAALTLLKAWNTGHPGGITTIHANSAFSALRRLEQLTAEVSQQPMREVIGEAVDLIVSIERTDRGRQVRDAPCRELLGRPIPNPILCPEGGAPCRLAA